MITEEQIKAAEAKFGDLIRSENARIEAMKKDSEVKDFSKLTHIKVGILPVMALVRSSWSRRFVW
jgi:isocitrate dehydrogenase (NAD+)